MASSWAILRLGDLPIPRSLALTMALDSLIASGDNIDNYLFADD